MKHTVVSPDGKTIASGGFDGAITLWDAKTGKELRRIKGPFVSILDLEFSPDENGWHAAVSTLPFGTLLQASN